MWNDYKELALTREEGQDSLAKLTKIIAKDWHSASHFAPTKLWVSHEKKVNKKKLF